jgi:hypothetical protein
MRLLAELVICAGVPAKPKPGEGWSRARRSRHGCLYRSDVVARVSRASRSQVDRPSYFQTPATLAKAQKNGTK